MYKEIKQVFLFYFNLSIEYYAIEYMHHLTFVLSRRSIPNYNSLLVQLLRLWIA